MIIIIYTIQVDATRDRIISLQYTHSGNRANRWCVRFTLVTNVLSKCSRVNASWFSTVHLPCDNYRSCATHRLFRDRFGRTLGWQRAVYQMDMAANRLQFCFVSPCRLSDFLFKYLSLHRIESLATSGICK